MYVLVDSACCIFGLTDLGICSLIETISHADGVICLKTCRLHLFQYCSTKVGALAKTINECNWKVFYKGNRCILKLYTYYF